MEDSIIMRKETDGKYSLTINGIKAEHINIEDASILLRRWEKEQLRKGRVERATPHPPQAETPPHPSAALTPSPQGEG